MTAKQARAYERARPKMAALIRRVIHDNREILRALAHADIAEGLGYAPDSALMRVRRAVPPRVTGVGK